MKKKHFYNIEYFQLTKKEKKYLLKNFFDEKSKPIKDKEVYSHFIYPLKDGRILSDLTDLVTRLFSSQKDYQYYEQTVNKVVEKEQQKVRNLEIQDDKFIEKLDFYLSSFETEFSLKLDFTDRNSMKKLDKLLDSLNEKEVIKHKNSIVAAIGNFFLISCPNLKWQYTDGSYGTIIPILKVGNFFIEPTLIYNSLVFYRGRKRRKSIISKYVNSYLHYYNLSQKT